MTSTASQWNLTSFLISFVNGEHPLYNGKNGTPLQKLDTGKVGRYYQIKPENSANIYRFGGKYNQAAMTKGGITKVC
jgi:hypothetical protein